MITSCSQGILSNNVTSDSVPVEPAKSKGEKVAKRVSFKNLSEIITDSSDSIWADRRDKQASLALHFMYKDTLAVSYSSECWLIYPYKIDGNKLIVYWDNNIDTKYDFDIVKAVNKIDKKYLGKPFMVLELANDTTFKATYPIQQLIKRINSVSKYRTFFPNEYRVVQPVSYDEKGYD